MFFFTYLVLILLPLKFVDLCFTVRSYLLNCMMYSTDKKKLYDVFSPQTDNGHPPVGSPSSKSKLVCMSPMSKVRFPLGAHLLVGHGSELLASFPRGLGSIGKSFN